MDYLLFLQSIRPSNFKFHVASIGKFLLCMFAFDHVPHHYTMEMSKEVNPEVSREFDVNGNFKVVQTKNRFSKMVLYKQHEQVNKDVKGK